MIESQFFEEYGLYKPYSFWQEDQNKISKEGLPKIRMDCPKCGVLQTFRPFNIWAEGYEQFSATIRNGQSSTGYRTSANSVFKFDYVCSGCEHELYRFMIHFRPDKATIHKVGQYPTWSIAVDNSVKKVLGVYLERYKRGLVCESQGYGIGAFGYYRRIVEGIIDTLLDAVGDLIPPAEKEQYNHAIAQTKSSRVAQEKIDLVKDLLPESLRPDGMNPLGILHHALSEGIHSLSDDECLDYAQEIRTTLEFLLSQIENVRQSKKLFTESMRKLLDKKAKAT